MTYQVRLTEGARTDLKRLYGFLAEHDAATARRALEAIRKGLSVIAEFPFSCRKAVDDNPFLREMLISFGAQGYVALYEISENHYVTVVALRHQLEEDYY